MAEFTNDVRDRFVSEVFTESAFLGESMLILIGNVPVRYGIEAVRRGYFLRAVVEQGSVFDTILDCGVCLAYGHLVVDTRVETCKVIDL